MQIVENKKINEAIDVLIEGGVDLKTVLSQNGLIKELTRGISNISVKRYGFENGFSLKPYLFVSFQVSFYFYRQNMSP